MILAISVLTGIVKFFVPINKILKAIIYFCIYAVPYFIISIHFGGFGKGNMLIVLITIYLLAFAVIYAISQILMLIATSICVVSKIGGGFPFGPILWTAFFVLMYYSHYKKDMK
jgi:hypothetical protein